jgi:hypothetical protein
MTQKPLPTPTPVTAAYWEAAARDELQLQRCRRCDERFLYPRLWCPKCWSMSLAQERASGRGAVIACTTVYQAPSSAYQDDVPYVVAIVRLREGPQLMANVVGCDPTAVEVGTQVTVAFEDRDDMRIPQFQLARPET